MNDDYDPFKSLQRTFGNCMSWIMMSFNQIFQVNHLLIWIVKLSHLVLSLMMVISLLKLLKGRMKRVKMIKMMKNVRHQHVFQLMKSKTRWKRCKAYPCSVHVGTKFVPSYWTWKACYSVSGLII